MLRCAYIPCLVLLHIFLKLMPDDDFCMHAAVRGTQFDSRCCYMSVVVIDSVFDFPDSEIFIYSKMSSELVHY